MRSVAHSTRTTIRIATILAAAASLLLALTAPFLGTAHADGDLPVFQNSPYSGEAAVLEIVKGQLDDFDISQSGKNGNPGCDDIAVLLGVSGDVDEAKFGANPPQGSTQSFGDGTSVTLTSIYTDSESGWKLFDFAVDGGLEVFAVFFKQSNGGVLFDYTPDTTSGDTGLHSEKADGVVSHISFCAVEAQPGGGDQDPDPSTTLTLIKIVQGGEASFSDFSPVVTSGDDTLDFSFFGSQEDAEATDVEPGLYTLGEQADDDYDLTSIVCVDGDNTTATQDGAQTLDVTLEEGDEVTCTFTNVFSTIDDDDDSIDEDDDLLDDDIIDTVVLDDVITGDDDTTGGAADNTDVKAGTDVLDAADELPATGLETIHLALLAALLAALGILFLLGTETDKVRVHRA